MSLFQVFQKKNFVFITEQCREEIKKLFFNQCIRLCQQVRRPDEWSRDKKLQLHLSPCADC